MLDLRAVVADFDGFERRLARRGEGAVAALAPVKPLASRRRELNVLLEKQKKELNEANARMRDLAKGDKAAMEGTRAELRGLSEVSKRTESELADIEAEISRLLLLVPNPPQDSVPLGKDESSNVIVSSFGDKPVKSFSPKPHWELGESLGILEWQQAAKLSGSRFTIYKGAAARLERAIASFFIDLHVSRGYT